jgi:hypothetical protein
MRQIPVNTPPLALATLAGMIQGQVLPVRTAHARQSTAKDEGANPMSNNQAQERCREFVRIDAETDSRASHNTHVRFRSLKLPRQRICFSLTECHP